MVRASLPHFASMTDTDTKETTIASFDGLRANFKTFKNDLEDSIQSKDKASYIPKAAQLCADVLLLLMTRTVPDEKPATPILPKHVELNVGLRQPMEAFLRAMGWAQDQDFDPTPFVDQLMLSASHGAAAAAP